MSEVIQLSVFIANEAGRVSEVTSALGEADINIRGFSVSDSADYGILRLVVDKPAEAHEVLKRAGGSVRRSSPRDPAPDRGRPGARDGPHGGADRGRRGDILGRHGGYGRVHGECIG